MGVGYVHMALDGRRRRRVDAAELTVHLLVGSSSSSSPATDRRKHVYHSVTVKSRCLIH